MLRLFCVILIGVLAGGPARAQKVRDNQAQETELLAGGLTAVKRLGLWALFNAAGKRITEWEYSWLQHLSNTVLIQAGDTFFDSTGKKLFTASCWKIKTQLSNWIKLWPSEDFGPEIRDENGVLIFPAGQWEKTYTVGTRFVNLYRTEEDRIPQTWDLDKKAFSPFLVEEELTKDAYLVYNIKTKERRILKEDSFLSLPYFTSIYTTREGPFYFITDLGTRANNFQQNSFPELLQDSFLQKQPNKGLTAVLNANLELILPPAYRFRNLKVLSPNVLLATTDSNNVSTLFTASGAPVLEMKGPVTFGGGGLWNSPYEVYLKLSNGLETAYLNLDGKILGRGWGMEALFDFKNNFANKLPQFLLYAHAAGKEKRLHNLEGQVVNERVFEYLRDAPAPGQFCLRSGDSLYFVNKGGKMLYGGRGFTTKTNFRFLKDFRIIAQNQAQKWGILDSNGKEILPFEWDSVARVRQYEAPSELALCKGEKWTVINDRGQFYYPPQPWKPTYRNRKGDYLSSNQECYHIAGGKVLKVPLTYYWDRETLSGSFKEFPLGYRKKISGNGIISNTPTDTAIYHLSFSWPYAVLTDTVRNRIALFDTMGQVVVPPTALPAALITSGTSVVLVYRGGKSFMFCRQKKGYRKEEIYIDTPQRNLFEAAGNRAKVYYYNSFTFTTLSGKKGIYSDNGVTRTDLKFRAVNFYQKAVVLAQKGHYGLLTKDSLQWLYPPTADSVIVREKDYDYRYEIYEGGRMGMYYYSRGSYYVPPIYQQVLNPYTLTDGFLVVKDTAGYLVLNEALQPLTPHFDTLTGNLYYLPYMQATLAGKKVSLRITDSNTIEILEGSRARLKYADPNGYYHGVVRVQQEGRWGLWNNYTFEMVVPALFDSLQTAPDYTHFMARKKGLPADSFYLFNQSGTQLWAGIGAVVPVWKEGFWFVGGAATSPVLNAEGTEVIPAGYEVDSLHQNAFFEVWKGDSMGLISKEGKWLVPTVFDYIWAGTIDGFTFFKARKTVPDGQTRYALISAEGNLLTGAVYNAIWFGDHAISFQRNGVEGFLNAEGVETIRPWPKKE